VTERNKTFFELKYDFVMKKLYRVGILIAVTVIVVSCGPSLKVSSDYDKAANFGQYKTFSLYRSDSLHESISQLNQDRIFNSVKNEMTKKGFQETTSNPDLLINVVAILKDRVAVSSTTDYYGYGGVYRPYYWGTGMGTTSTTNYNVQHYKDGSLIIDVIDAGTKKLLWQGTGNKEIDKPAKDPDTAIPKAISSIMASFPPGAKKS
jgi:hypothetical protein